MYNKIIMTPLMAQYYSIKNRFKDFILLFRLGDFYEMFDEDAETCAPVLGIILTKKGENPMCGFQFNSADIYIKKLIEANFKIAICEQLETPEEAKSQKRNIVKRDVTKIITKGTYFDITKTENNFICSVVKISPSEYGICSADLGTGESFYEEICEEHLITSLYKLSPSEIILSSNIPSVEEFFPDLTQVIELEIDNISKNKKLKEEDCKNLKLAITLLEIYLSRNLQTFSFDNIKNIGSNYMYLPFMTIKNLELLPNKNKPGSSLLELLDKTQTPMGKRLLKNRLVRPLMNKVSIEERLDCVQFFIDKILDGYYCKITIGDIYKLATNCKTPLHARKLAESLEMAQDFIDSFQTLPDFLFRKKNKLCKIEISQQILKMIVEEPGDFGEGQIFFPHYHDKTQEEYKKICEEISKLTEKTGFKIKNNNLIGYFYEVNTASISKVPSDFILKQGLVNCSRYTNAELTLLESKLIEAKEKILTEEKILFQNILNDIENELNNIYLLADLISNMDYFICLAKNSIENKYFRPTFSDEKKISIKDGRHPIVESKNKNFIKNNLNMDDETRGICLTGPNMGGKSTYLRQNAIILIMAQAGMFVPGRVETSIWNKVFVRIGAEDNIGEGQSTFMVEMNECAEILSEADDKSFVVLDEIGRGTSTIDGMSISISIIEYLHDILRSYFIVSTHYNELSMCSDVLLSLKNFKTSFVKVENKVFLLHKIEPGIAENSFGIEIACRAHLPNMIIERSRDVFNKMKINIDLKDIF